jgi:hypothetical protein
MLAYMRIALGMMIAKKAPARDLMLILGFLHLSSPRSAFADTIDLLEQGAAGAHARPSSA